jgi:hypothetical protein
MEKLFGVILDLAKNGVIPPSTQDKICDAIMTTILDDQPIQDSEMKKFLFYGWYVHTRFLDAEIRPQTETYICSSTLPETTDGV